MTIPTVFQDRASPRFVISMNRSKEGDLQVQACEISCAEFINRTGFDKQPSLQDVFIPSFVEKIKALLEPVGTQAEVLSFPEKVIQIPGLILAKAHVMITEMRDSAQMIILRFMHFFGGANRLFLKDVGLDDSIARRSEEIALDITSQLALPILDIVNALSRDLKDIGAKTWPVQVQLNDKASQFEQQIELIKRFLQTVSDGEDDSKKEAAPPRVFGPHVDGFLT